MNYEQKYLKYKKKYLEMKAQVGGVIQQPVALQQVPIQQPVAFQQVPIQPVAFQQIPVLNYKESEQIDISFEGHYYYVSDKDSYMNCGTKTNKNKKFILRLKLSDNKIEITLSHVLIIVGKFRTTTKEGKIYEPIFENSEISQSESNVYNTKLKFKLNPNDTITDTKCVYLDHDNRKLDLNNYLYGKETQELFKQKIKKEIDELNEMPDVNKSGTPYHKQLKDYEKLYNEINFEERERFLALLNYYNNY